MSKLKAIILKGIINEKFEEIFYNKQETDISELKFVISKNNVDSVKQAVSIISEKMETTTEAIKNGQSHIKALNNFTEVSETAGKEVSDALKTF